MAEKLSYIVNIIIGFLIGSFVFVAFLLFIAIIMERFYDFEMDVWWKIKKQKENIIHKKINFMLMDICDTLHIPVYVKSDEWFNENRPDAAGYISYNKDNLGINHAEIYLRDDKSYEFYGWTTFAHEIGHYISINQFDDRSETGAEYEAGKLLLKLLDSEEDKAFIKFELASMLEKEPEHSHKYIKFPEDNDAGRILNGMHMAKISVMDFAISKAKNKLQDDKEIMEEEAKIKFPFYCKSMYDITMKDYKEAGY